LPRKNLRLWGRGPIGRLPHIFQVLSDLLDLAPPPGPIGPGWLPGLLRASPSTPLDVALMWRLTIPKRLTRGNRLPTQFRKHV